MTSFIKEVYIYGVFTLETKALQLDIQTVQMYEGALAIWSIASKHIPEIILFFLSQKLPSDICIYYPQ